MANADAPIKPRQLKDISVIFNKAGSAATEFRKAVQSFRFEPQQSVTAITGGTPDAVWTDIPTPTWTLSVKFIQDAETLGSMTDYLYIHAGDLLHVDFVPYGGTGWGCDTIVPAPPIGGDVGAWLADTVTFAVRGKPTRTADDLTTTQQ